MLHSTEKKHSLQLLELQNALFRKREWTLNIRLGRLVEIILGNVQEGLPNACSSVPDSDANSGRGERRLDG